jgi:hypothetical protein
MWLSMLSRVAISAVVNCAHTGSGRHMATAPNITDNISDRFPSLVRMSILSSEWIA